MKKTLFGRPIAELKKEQMKSDMASKMKKSYKGMKLSNKEAVDFFTGKGDAGKKYAKEIVGKGKRYEKDEPEMGGKLK